MHVYFLFFAGYFSSSDFISQLNFKVLESKFKLRLLGKPHNFHIIISVMLSRSSKCKLVPKEKVTFTFSSSQLKSSYFTSAQIHTKVIK